MSQPHSINRLPGGPTNRDEKLLNLLEFAEKLARRVGRNARDAALNREDAVTKANAADWVTPIDGQSEDAIRRAISDRFPHHAIVGEERPSQGDVAHAPVVWHIDPIDGTTNFLYGLGNVSVSIAAIDRHGPAVGVVHDLYRDQTIGAARDHGVRVNGGAPTRSNRATAVTGEIVLTEWSGGYHPWPGMNAFLNWVIGHQGTVRIIGSSALALAHAGLGRAAVTILPGRHHSWDLAAGVVIATEGGCRLMGVDGESISLPSDGLLVAGPDLADEVWAAWRESVAIAAASRV